MKVYRERNNNIMEIIIIIIINMIKANKKVLK